jgi:tRNA G18 (ribose-2'-O)-methylase SpoU
MRNIVLIAHNLRSAHNVGALLRTADGLGINKVYLSGYTPYPKEQNDTRLPHIAVKLDKQIAKTALGAEKSMDWEHHTDIFFIINELREAGYQIVALEQTNKSQALELFDPPGKLAIIAGREVEGIEKEILEMAETHIEIPMSGQKESYNVAIAAAIALYHCRFYDRIRTR